jgi:hypothetical protein
LKPAPKRRIFLLLLGTFMKISRRGANES